MIFDDLSLEFWVSRLSSVSVSSFSFSIKFELEFEHVSRPKTIKAALSEKKTQSHHILSFLLLGFEIVL